MQRSLDLRRLELRDRPGFTDQNPVRLRFFGVRGSVASAGDSTRRYGGNTSCVSLEIDETQIIFDAGTGIRPLGDAILKRAPATPRRAHLFLSHVHWDHIQGFPFFAPAYVPGYGVAVHRVRPGANEPDVRSVFASQMRAPTFPVGLEAMRGDLDFVDLAPRQEVLVGRALVRNALVDHPNGCAAYRVDADTRSVVYATDLEHGAEPDPSLVELARGADLLIYDAMYTPEEYEGLRGPSRKGWGHSTFEAGAALAEAADVRHLCLFHHDPAHDDAFMDALAQRARQRFARSLVAAEGLELRL